MCTQEGINTLRPRQNGRHFADDIFRCIFFNEIGCILINISLKSVPNGPINNIPALVQIMAWCRPGDKPLSEPMMVSLPTHICVTRPQRVPGLSQMGCEERPRELNPPTLECSRDRSNMIEVFEITHGLYDPTSKSWVMHILIGRGVVSTNCKSFLHVKHQWLILFPAWIGNYIRYKVLDDITYPFPKFHRTTSSQKVTNHHRH